MPPEIPEELDLHNLEMSWQIWQYCEAVSWQHLPYAGGVLDQPEWLLDDLMVISANYHKVERMIGVK